MLECLYFIHVYKNMFIIFFIFVLFFIEVQLVYNIILISGLKHQGSTICIYYKMLVTISIVTICYHAKVLQYYLLYSLCCAFHPCDLFNNWNFVPFQPFTYFTCPPSPHPYGNYQFVLYCESVFGQLVLFFRFHM